MRALRFSKPGEPLDVLRLDDVPVPTPGPINPFDLRT